MLRQASDRPMNAAPHPPQLDDFDLGASAPDAALI